MQFAGWTSAALAAVLAGSLLAWWRIIARWWTGKPLLRGTAQRGVGWTALDIALIAVFVLATQLMASSAMGLAHDRPVGPPEGEAGLEHPATHPLGRLLAEDRRLTTWLLCLLSAVGVAPLVEEFLFRVLLQGWLEHITRQDPESGRRQGTDWNPLLPWLPIVVTSLLFAAMHVRTSAEGVDPDELRVLILVDALTKSGAFVAAVAYLRLARNVQYQDLGLAPARCGHLARIVAWGYLAVVPPLFLLQFALNSVLEGWSDIAPDPIPLFFFSMALGYLYRQTRRAWYPMLLHMLLNATSLLIVAAFGN